MERRKLPSGAVCGRCKRGKYNPIYEGGLRAKEMIDVSKVNQRKLDSVNQMIAVAQKYLFVKRLIIFGSAVTDYCTDESDIDVCADVELKEKGLNLYNLRVDL